MCLSLLRLDGRKFPLGGEIRQTNKLYLNRLRQLDAEVSKFGNEFSGLVFDV